MDGLEVLGAHQELIVHLNLIVGILVAETVGAAAYLRAGAPVCRAVHGVEAEVALAADGHAQSAVAEHLYAHRLSARAKDGFADDGAVNGFHLREVELAAEHHRLGPLRVIPHRLGVGDVGLRGDMHGYAAAAAVEDGGDVGGYDSRDAGVGGRVDDAVHLRYVVIVDNGVYGEV